MTLYPELLILALASTFRLASLAAIYALLQRDTAPRLLLAYIVAGLVFVFTVGAVIVLVLHGVDVQRTTHSFRRITELLGGLALLVLAFVALAGRLPTDTPGEGRSAKWARSLDERVTMRGAALAGVLTHVPGVFYLVALDLIISSNPNSTVRGLRETAIFDVVWFALPIAVLAAVLLRPSWARGAMDSARRFTARRAPQLIAAVSTVLGAALVIDAVK